jgi:hypothetical protein
LSDIVKVVNIIKIGNNSVPTLNIYGKLCNNVQIIANIINSYLSAPLPQIQSSIFSEPLHSISYLFKAFKHPFPTISMTPATNKEIKDIIKSLK